MNRWGTWRFCCIALIALTFAGGLACPVGPASASEAKMMLTGLFGSDPKAPDFELPDLDGNKIALSKYKGNRPVLFYFWATWCPHCMAAKPAIISIRKDIPESNLEILAINVGGGDSIERLKKYRQGHPMPYPLLYDGDQKVCRAYQVQGIPLFVLVDKEGKVLYRANELPRNVKELLKLK